MQAARDDRSWAGGRSPQSPEEEAPSTSGGDAAAAAAARRETVLGNCARCGSADRLKFCSRCNAVRYCSPDCQKADVRDQGNEWGGVNEGGGGL